MRITKSVQAAQPSLERCLMTTTREGRLRGRDLALAVGAAALLLVVVLAASIRHDAHCERGGEEDAETAASLARQALAARLLGAEQEALENQLLVKRVAGLVAEERVEAASFSDLYADADLLARAVDAYFRAPFRINIYHALF